MTEANGSGTTVPEGTPARNRGAVGLTTSRRCLKKLSVSLEHHDQSRRNDKFVGQPRDIRHTYAAEYTTADFELPPCAILALRTGEEAPSV